MGKTKNAEVSQSLSQPQIAHQWAHAASQAWGNSTSCLEAGRWMR